MCEFQLHKTITNEEVDASLCLKIKSLKLNQQPSAHTHTHTHTHTHKIIEYKVF